MWAREPKRLSRFNIAYPQPLYTHNSEFRATPPQHSSPWLADCINPNRPTGCKNDCLDACTRPALWSVHWLMQRSAMPAQNCRIGRFHGASLQRCKKWCWRAREQGEMAEDIKIMAPFHGKYNLTSSLFGHAKEKSPFFHSSFTLAHEPLYRRHDLFYFFSDPSSVPMIQISHPLCPHG